MKGLCTHQTEFNNASDMSNIDAKKFVFYILGLIVAAFLCGIGVIAFLDKRIDERQTLKLGGVLPAMFKKLVREGDIEIPPGQPGINGAAGHRIYRSEDIIIDTERKGSQAVNFPDSPILDPESIAFCFVTVSRPPEPSELGNVRAIYASSSKDGVKISWEANGHFRLHAYVYAVVPSPK